MSLSVAAKIQAGGSGGSGGGGGGAGGGLHDYSVSLSPGSYGVTVGAGGGPNSSGSISIFNGQTSTGGQNSGNDNGGDCPEPPYSGGLGQGSSINAGGGAGIGGAGSDGQTFPGIANFGGDGGPGQNPYSLFGGQGGGGGGGGGDGQGAATDGGGAGTGANGTVNTGGGGGGVYGGGTSGSGGSGNVIIRYLTADAAAYVVTGGTKSTSGSYTYHRFTTSGNLVITLNVAFTKNVFSMQAVNRASSY